RRRLGTDLVQDLRHHLRLHGENDRLRATDERAVVLGALDLVRALQAAELRVDGVARPEVRLAIALHAQQPLHERAGHVAGAEEAHLLPPPSRRGLPPRSPKSTRPRRTKVAPSSTATAKSSLIPMERWGSSTPRRRATSSRRSLRARKCGRASAGSATGGPI